ncbi:Calcium-binding mitochondrial carrier protein [Sarcoptes scabiei]|nr:Calcium-binding mitochondrial carrier protein [Sarcoptes scabiei]
MIVDDDKIRDLGPERAAAEWLIRNGAKVVWSKRPDQLSNDYDAIVNDDTDERKYEKDTIIAIDATGSSINHVGFPYLKNLKNLRKIIFNETEFLDNQALKLLKEFQIDLKHLEIIKCFDITDGGILFLKDLRSLEFLKLEQLDSVKNRQYCYDILKNSLDSCKIVWN